MRIRIDRLLKTSGTTLGTLSISYEGLPWVWECYTREPPTSGLRGLRLDHEGRLFISGETALPVGLYTVSRVYSRKLARMVPLVVSAQLLAGGGHRQALGMRILPGHYTLQDDIGIIVGQKQGPSEVHHTRQAFDPLDEKILKCIARTEAVELEIAE